MLGVVLVGPAVALADGELLVGLAEVCVGAAALVVGVSVVGDADGDADGEAGAELVAAAASDEEPSSAAELVTCAAATITVLDFAALSLAPTFAIAPNGVAVTDGTAARASSRHEKLRKQTMATD